jgi:hypothetical protein
MEAIRIATVALAQFPEVNMPNLSNDLWEKHVVDRLSFQQQRTVAERSYTTLRQLDFAALLWVFDQNWYEFASRRTAAKFASLFDEAGGGVRDMTEIDRTGEHA